MEAKVQRIERGWAGHFICANRCRFRRNTLLTCGDIKIVVSTVGAMESSRNTGKTEFETIGFDRYFETMAFHSDPEDLRYSDINVQRPVDFASPWAIGEIDADDRANDMHETVVAEIMAGLQQGLTYPSYRDDES